MYRPGMGVDPWYENFKFFLTYWLLSSNNRDRMGDVDQLPPLPPNGAPGPPFMSPPPHKNNGAHNTNGSGPDQQNGQNSQNPQQNQQQGQQTQQNSSAKSPNPIPPPTSVPNPTQISSWDNIEKVGHNNASAGRLSQSGGSHPGSLVDAFGGNLSSFKQPMGSHNSPHNPLGSHGNHLGHQLSNHGNSILPEHIIVDKDRRHVCPHCYKGFRSRQQLNQHNLVHSGVRKYHCLYCERAFKQLSHLQQHHRIHTGEKPYRCPLDGCDKAFAQMSNLQHHMRQHDKATFGQKQCMCPFCDRGYASEKSLKSHLSKMHPDSKLFGLGGQRHSLPLMDGQGHPMLGTSQSGIGLSPHNRNLPMMHPGMKSPLTPQGGPLELTVNSHQRNTMGSDTRKYSLDSNKGFSMGGNIGPHDSKIFQRSLSDRLPDRSSVDKLDSMFDQRFGYQNPLRDVNRFSDRSFEPFSPSRLHEMVRSFDFKEIEAKLFDPSFTSEKFQRMAENFNEFKSRFQDQMFPRDGGQRSSFPFDTSSRNRLQEMNERNAFFNSRNDNLDFGNRDRFESTSNRSFNGVGVNDLDNFGANRNDLARIRSRNDMGSRTSMNSPDFNRRRESVTDSLSMSMETQLDIRRNSLNIDQNLNGRNASSNSDVMIPRSGDMATPHDNNVLSSNQRSEVLSTSDSDIMGLRQGQRTGMEGQGNGMDTTQQGIDHGSIEQRNSLEQRNNTEADMMALNRQRSNLEMPGSSMRMMGPQMDRPDLPGNCNGMISPNGGMMLSGTRNDNSSTPLNIVDRGSEQERGFETRLPNNDMADRSNTDFDIMERNNMNLNQDKDKMHGQDDMVVDNNMNMENLQRDTEMAMQSHPQSLPIGSLCNNMEVANQAYSTKRDVHMRNQLMGDVNVHDELNPLSRSNSIPQLGSHHSTSKQNGHDPTLQDEEMDFCGRSDDKSSPGQNLSDPNMIRQRKQRKPSNPQHVFMPSLDQYTSFATDEVEEVGALI